MRFLGTLPPTKSTLLRVRLSRGTCVAAAITCALLLLTNALSAQGKQVEFKHLTVVEGLSHSQVNAIVQDHHHPILFQPVQPVAVEILAGL